jgi:hypothetical protein
LRGYVRRLIGATKGTKKSDSLRAATPTAGRLDNFRLKDHRNLPLANHADFWLCFVLYGKCGGDGERFLAFGAANVFPLKAWIGAADVPA